MEREQPEVWVSKDICFTPEQVAIRALVDRLDRLLFGYRYDEVEPKVNEPELQM